MKLSLSGVPWASLARERPENALVAARTRAGSSKGGNSSSGETAATQFTRATNCFTSWLNSGSSK